jgi:hypothetical protein
VKFTLVAAERFTAVGDAERRPSATSDPPPPDSDPEPDAAELEEAIDLTDAPPHRPEARLTEELGATVVDEVPRH